jgi:hypothetical protein
MKVKAEMKWVGEVHPQEGNKGHPVDDDDLVGGWFIHCGQKQRQIGGGGDISSKTKKVGEGVLQWGGWHVWAPAGPPNAGPPKLGRNFSPNLWPDTTRHCKRCCCCCLPPCAPPPPPPPGPCGTQASVRFSWFLFPCQICYIFGLLLLNWCLH